MTLSLSGIPITLDAIFQTTSLQTDYVFGWTLGFVLIVNAIVSIPLLVVIVQRAKQVLDFVATLHGFHLLGCWLYSRHFPSTVTWWMVQVAALLVMTLGGEWACMRYEMKPILLGNSINKGGPDLDIRAKNKDAQESGVFPEMHIEDGLNNTENDPSSSSSIQSGLTKKSKRKTSDAEKSRQQQSEGQEGPLIAIVGLAKKKILNKSQNWIPTTSQGLKDYETIPMDNMDNN